MLREYNIQVCDSLSLIYSDYFQRINDVTDTIRDA